MFSIAPDYYVNHVLGGRLQAVRKGRRMTQASLADQIGVDRSWVSHVEAGRRGTSPGRLRAICQVLNCDPALLLGL